MQSPEVQFGCKGGDFALGNCMLVDNAFGSVKDRKVALDLMLSLEMRFGVL
jgi:hypothetical protein